LCESIWNYGGGACKSWGVWSWWLCTHPCKSTIWQRVLDICGYRQNATIKM